MAQYQGLLYKYIHIAPLVPVLIALPILTSWENIRLYIGGLLEPLDIK